MKTIAIACALTFGLVGLAEARNHPPPIKCDPPRVARLVTVMVHHYQPRHVWKCVLPGRG